MACNLDAQELRKDELNLIADGRDEDTLDKNNEIIPADAIEKALLF